MPWSSCWLIMLLSVNAQAHDFWLEADQYRPTVGTTVALGLRVGQKFNGDSVPRIPAWFQRFDARLAGRKIDVAGDVGDEPAGHLRINEPGAYQVVYFSIPGLVKLDAEKFSGYLREEGLEKIIELRRATGQQDQISRELFTRCAKSLLLTQGAPPFKPLEPTGLPLELEALSEPRQPVPAQFTVRLRYRDQPVAGALVIALNRDGELLRVAVRTGTNGLARLTLPRAGVWLIKSVHMIAADPALGVDWQSYWASLTLQIGGI